MRAMRLRRGIPLGRTTLINSALGLLLVGGGTWAYFMISGDAAPAEANTTRTVAVAQGTVTATVTADGSIESANTMSADFATGGTVTAIKVKVGDRVAKGAVLATVGIFLPAFVFVALSGPLVPRLRRSWVAGAFLDGVNVASLALMAVVTWQLGRAALVDAWTVGLAAVSAVLLIRFRVNSAWLVLGGGAVGMLLGAR